jgi:hypothetical protein
VTLATQANNSNPLEMAAMKYASLGWHVLPCRAGEKRPLTANGFRDATTEESTIRRWWHQWPDANVGIATGDRSDVWVLDVDGPQGLAEWNQLQVEHGNPPKTRTVRTPRGGLHLYFVVPHGGDIGCRTKIAGTSIDVRGTGGYVVAPPSSTPDGNYQLVHDIAIAPASAWLLDFVTQTRPATKPEVSLPIPTATRPDACSRAVAYVQAMPEAISGQGGHDAAFRVARACYTGFGLSVDETFKILRDVYNPRCQPSWSEQELRHKAKSVAETPSEHPRGYLFSSQRSIPASLPLGNLPVISSSPNPPKPRFEFLDSRTFAQGDYRPEWLIKNVLVRGEPAGLGGPMKALKTSIAVDLAVSLATGTPMLGTFEVPHVTTTAIISGESGRSTLQKTGERVCAAKNLTLAEVDDRLHWCFEIPCLSDLGGVTQLVEALCERGVRVAILDPLYLMLGDINAGSIFEAGTLLRNVASLFLAYNITPVILHHARKVLPVGQGMELSDLSHAGFAEFVRQYLLINRMERYEHDGRHILNLRIGGSAGHGGEYSVEVNEGTLNEDFSGRRWDVTVKSEHKQAVPTVEDREATKIAAHVAKMKGKTTKFLANLDEELATGVPAVTANKLKTKYGWQNADLQRIVECLLLDKQIELHDFTYTAGKGAQREAQGYRRPVSSVQPSLPFELRRGAIDQPVETADQPVGPAESTDQPVDPGEGDEINRSTGWVSPDIGGTHR